MNMTPYRTIVVRARRGMALMLVMIALVIGSVLTAGYLLTQNTAIGLTKNQAASDMARHLASTGIDCALYYMKSTDYWNASNYNLNWRLIADQSSTNRILVDNDIFAGGHVRVELKPVAPATTFSADARTAVDIVSTGTSGGQSVTLTSRVQSTGDGTPWSQGIFALGSLTLSGTYSVLDSYKSGNAGPSVYNNLIQILYRNYANVAAMGSITVDGATARWGSSMAYADASNITTRNGGSCTPKPAVNLPMKRVPGWVTPPNVNQFTNLPALTTMIKDYVVTDGVYPTKFEIIPTNGIPPADPAGFVGTVVNFRGSGVIYIPYDMCIYTGSTLRVRQTTSGRPSDVVFYVTGNVDIQGRIVIDPGCTMKIVAANQVLLERYARVNTDSMNNLGNTVYDKTASVGPKVFQIYGLPSCPKVQMQDHAWMSGCIFAPQSFIQLTCDSSSTTSEAVTLFGAIVGDDVKIQGASKVHQDLDSASAAGVNITGGTYAGEYEVRQSW